MDPVVAIDFEITGLSPDYGDRATEITAVLIRGRRIVGQYQSLMSSGRHIPPSPSTSSESAKPWCAKHLAQSRSMAEIADFVGNYGGTTRGSASVRSRPGFVARWHPPRRSSRRPQTGCYAKQFARCAVALGPCSYATMQESQRCE